MKTECPFCKQQGKVEEKNIYREVFCTSCGKSFLPYLTDTQNMDSSSGLETRHLFQPIEYKYPVLAKVFNVFGCLGLLLGAISFLISLSMLGGINGMRDAIGFFAVSVTFVFFSLICFGFACALDNTSLAAFNSKRVLEILKSNQK